MSLKIYKIFLFQTNKANVTAINNLLGAEGYDIAELPPYDNLYVKKGSEFKLSDWAGVQWED